jgi:hypothetical protein
MDMRKFSTKEFPDGTRLSKKDYVIILGDYGLIWAREESMSSIYWRKWLLNKPWTTLFLDGNHENHELLAELPQVPMFGSTVGVAYGGMYHLKRGEIYTIGDKTFFTMGGATSVDKESRLDRVSWWKEEVPSWAEFDHGLSNLELHGNKVDYILGHTCPKEIARIYLKKIGLDKYEKENDPVCSFFDTIIQQVEFKDFYFGHWHADWDFGKYHMRYDTITELP